MRHHDETLAAFTRTPGEDWLAVVLDGSVARGRERPDSDVDVTVVVTEEAFEQARAGDRVSYVDREVATYERGYVDVKVVTLALLAAGAVRGDEPMRAAFTEARVAWSRDDAIRAELEHLLKGVVELDEEEWERRMASAIAVVRLQAGYFAKQAFASGRSTWFVTRHSTPSRRRAERCWPSIAPCSKATSTCSLPSPGWRTHRTGFSIRHALSWRIQRRRDSTCLSGRWRTSTTGR